MEDINGMKIYEENIQKRKTLRGNYTAKKSLPKNEKKKGGIGKLRVQANCDPEDSDQK